MTPDDPNALIAKAMSADPDPKWRAWEACRQCNGTGDVGGVAQQTCPSCLGAGRIPRDYADPSNTLLLVEWAGWQEWWFDEAAGKDFDDGLCPMALVNLVFEQLMAREIDAPAAGRNIANIIAHAIVEKPQ